VTNPTVVDHASRLPCGPTRLEVGFESKLLGRIVTNAAGSRSTRNRVLHAPSERWLWWGRGRGRRPRWASA